MAGRVFSKRGKVRGAMEEADTAALLASEGCMTLLFVCDAGQDLAGVELRLDGGPHS